MLATTSGVRRNSRARARVLRQGLPYCGGCSAHTVRGSRASLRVRANAMRTLKSHTIGALIVLGTIIACRPGSPRQAAVLPGVDNGRRLVFANGCGSCHVIS